jgi:hypothetical protein
MSITKTASGLQAIPLLNSSEAFIHQLAGGFPEYVGEPRTLLEGAGYVKGCKVLQTSPLSTADATHIIKVLTEPENYGDPGMGARCFFPGFALSFSGGMELVHVQVCLECSWIVFHMNSSRLSFVPSEQGERQLRAIYERLAANL